MQALIWINSEISIGNLEISGCGKAVYIKDTFLRRQVAEGRPVIIVTEVLYEICSLIKAFIKVADDGGNIAFIHQFRMNGCSHFERNTPLLAKKIQCFREQKKFIRACDAFELFRRSFVIKRDVIEEIIIKKISYNVGAEAVGIELHRIAHGSDLADEIGQGGVNRSFPA